MSRKKRAPLLLAGFAVTLAFVTTAWAEDRILVVTTDFFSSGSITTLPTSPPFHPQVDMVPIHSDATAHVKDGLIYVVNRLGGDNIQVIDPASGYAVIHQFSVGAGTNPQDIAVVSGSSGYVSRYETNDLLKIDLQTGEHLGTISLTEFADGDGLCEMHRMHLEGDYLFVQVQRMLRQDWPNPWVPTPPSALVVIDIRVDQIVDVDPDRPGTQGVELAGLNPIARMQKEPYGSGLLVVCAGEYGVIDQGGIERVDLESWSSEGMVVTETALGGDPLYFSQWSSSKAYTVVSDPSFNTILCSVNPATGGDVQQIYNPGGYELGDVLAYPTGYLYVVDRNFVTPGVRIYDTGSDALVAGPIDTGLPPYELWLLPDSVSDVPLSSLFPSGPLFDAPFPNPSAGPVRVTWEIEPDTSIDVAIYDAHGRRVRKIADLSSGQSPIWDGRDALGRDVPAGVYLLRVGGAGKSQVASVRVIR